MNEYVGTSQFISAVFPGVDERAEQYVKNDLGCRMMGCRLKIMSGRMDAAIGKMNDEVKKLINTREKVVLALEKLQQERCPQSD